MSIKKIIEAAKAEEEGYRLVAYEATLRTLDGVAKTLLPEGYEVVNAVGWGATVIRAPEGVNLRDEDALPKCVRAFVSLLDDIAEGQGAGNEHFTSKGLKPEPETTPSPVM